MPLVALFIFAMGETALRVSSVAKFGGVGEINADALFRLDKATGLKLPMPGGEKGHLHFNSHGFRGPELSVEKSASTLRFAFLGNSTTLDIGLPAEKTWAARTTHYISQAVPPGCKVEYLNAALPGVGVPELHKYFSGSIHRFHPDLTIIMPGDVGNDNEAALKEMGYDKNDITKPSWAAEKSLLWSKIEQNMIAISLQRKARLGVGFIDFDDAKLSAQFKQRLAELVNDIHAKGSNSALVTITGYTRVGQEGDDELNAMAGLLYNPYTTPEELLEARESYNARITETGYELGSIVIDNKSAIPPDIRFFSDNLHFTAEGSKLQAKLVSERIIASDMFSALLKRVGGACAGG